MENNKENDDPKRKAFLKYQTDNRDKMNEYRRKWYAQNRAKKDSTKLIFGEGRNPVGRPKKLLCSTST
tara:strand:+ start:337 stop:540 length:204 start_codon:yes stop_codon:yes gene_type:complete